MNETVPSYDGKVGAGPDPVKLTKINWTPIENLVTS